MEEILDENHIIVLPDETVFPTKDSEIGSNKTIKIAKVGSEETEIVVLADSQDTISLEQVLGNYTTITEKIETVEEKIPYEEIISYLNKIL